MSRERIVGPLSRGVNASLTERLAWLAVLLVAWLAPFQPAISLVHGRLTDVRTASALGFLAVGLWLLDLGVSRRVPRLPRLLTLALLVWLALAVLAGLFAPTNRFDALKFTARLGLGVGVCLATADLARDAARRWTLARGMVMAGTVVGLLGLDEYSAWPPAVAFTSLFKDAPTLVGDQVRISSTFSYTTVAAMYLELVIPFAVGWLWRALSEWRRGVTLALVVALVILGEAMILTFTRSSLIAVLAALALMAGIAWRQRQRRLAFAAAGVGVGLALLVGATALVTPTLALRLRTENDRAWYGAQYAPPPLSTLRAGETVTVTVQVTNTGRLAWQPDAARPIGLSYHWLAHDEDAVANWEGRRAPVPIAVAPGQSTTIAVPVLAPIQSGPYRLAWDMVQDHVAWFSAKAVPMAIQPVDVTPGALPSTHSPPLLELQPLPRESAVDLSPSRRVLWGVALTMLRDRPLLGVGPDNFRLAYGRYTGQTIWDTGTHVNNMYLEMFADMGVPGGLAFLLLVAATAWTAWRALRRGLASTHDDAGPVLYLATAGAASLLAWHVHGVVDVFYAFLPLALVYWAILGLVASQSDT